MTTHEMEMLAQELATNHGRTIGQARAAIRKAMYDLARAVGMPEVKIQAYRPTVER